MGVAVALMPGRPRWESGEIDEYDERELGPRRSGEDLVTFWKRQRERALRRGPGRCPDPTICETLTPHRHCRCGNPIGLELRECADCTAEASGVDIMLQRFREELLARLTGRGRPRP